jgi:hydroxyacylglutathione hydrolase
LAEIQQITVQGLGERVHDRQLHVLDVRREGEWQAGHLADADWWPLDRFRSALPELDDKPVAVHCKSGYRSMIACSLLQRAGHPNVINVVGGFDAWQQAQLPFVTDAPVEA